MTPLRQWFMLQLTGRNTKARLIRGTGGTFIFRAMNMVLKFALSFVLARLLGAEQFGIYNFAMAWITLLVVPALFGMDRLWVRNFSVYISEKSWGTMRGLLRFALRATLRMAVLLAGVGVLVAWATYELTGRPALLTTEQADYAEPALITLIIALLLLLPMRALLLLQQSGIQGLRHVILAQLPEQVLQPVLFLTLLGGVYLIAGALESAVLAMALQIGSVGVALLWSTLLLMRYIPKPILQASPVYTREIWMAAAIPFVLNKGLTIINVQIDAIMLGILADAESVALFTISLRGTQIISLLLVSVNIVLAPHMAQLHAEGKQHQLQRAIITSARLATLAALPVTLAFAVFGPEFLSIFGPEFRAAHTALVALSIGQLINAATGSVGVLLLMTGHERAATIGNGFGIGVHLLLNAALIPRWGVSGAAIAGAAGIAAANSFQIVMAWRRLSIYTTALGNITQWRSHNNA